MSSLKTIQKSIIVRIEQAGYHSIELFAHENGLSKSTLSLILSGKRDPKVSTLDKIAKALRVDTGELFVVPKAKK